MAKLDLSGISKLGGYLLSNEGPLDVRTVVREYGHLAELVSSRIAYVGMVVYVNSGDTNKGLYVCESNTGGGSWKLINNSSEVDTIIQEYLKSKQDVITDLDTIRSGAAKGATALQSHQSLDHKQDVITDLATIRAGAAKGATALQAHQSLDHKQDVITDLETIRAGAAKGATAIQQHQDISGKQDVISDLATIRDGASKGATAVQPAALNDYALKSTLDNIQLLDTKVKLESELKTYYNVGRITTASGTNPVTIGNAGDSLRDVFNRLFNMDEVQPSITQQPSVSCSFSSSASDERGTTISSISYSITFNDGAYTNASSTGVSMTGYSFSSGTSSSTTATSGTLTLPSTYTVGTSSAFSTTLTANHSQGNIAKTNLGNNSNPTVRISSGSKTATPSFSKSAVDYPYFASSSSTSASTAASSKSKKETSLTTSSGASCTYGNGAYVWIFVRKGSATSQATKTIETYSEIAKAWGTLLGGTEKMGEVTFTKANGVSDTFYAYRTKNAAQEGATFTIRLT